MRALLRLCTEGVRRSCDWLLFDERCVRVTFSPLPLPAGEKVSVTRRGAMEVLDLLLSHDFEDDIFVRWMTWGTVILLLVIWCLQRFDATELAYAV